MPAPRSQDADPGASMPAAQDMDPSAPSSAVAAAHARARIEGTAWPDPATSAETAANLNIMIEELRALRRQQIALGSRKPGPTT